MRLQPLRPLEQLPAHEDDWEACYHGVRKEKGGDIPMTFIKLYELAS